MQNNSNINFSFFYNEKKYIPNEQSEKRVSVEPIVNTIDNQASRGLISQKKGEEGGVIIGDKRYFLRGCIDTFLYARDTSIYGTTVAAWAKYIGRMHVLATTQKDMLKYISVNSIEAEIRSLLTPQDKKRILRIKEEAKKKKEASKEKKHKQRRA